MTVSKARYSYARRILGDELFDRVQHARVLCVGAGGIGCEVLKNLVQAGFGQITIIDLDTIDLSNLNRQFLFQKQHVKRPKALVAKETASNFNPNVQIDAIHGNIKELQYDVEWFKGFDLVMNALDNLDARKHVNKMCLAADIPLFESGTAGFIGQVQPIKNNITECYECQPKDPPKTFPVCTIRSTPSTPIHCIVWAKSYLFPALFGVDDEQEELDLDKAASEGENPEEIRNLRKETYEMRELRQSLRVEGFERRVVEKTFTRDIQRLLSMDEMWRTRRKPIPIDYDSLLREPSSSEATSKANNNELRDQRALTVKDSFDLFIQSLSRLVERTKAAPNTPLEWDKDDDDALDFATSAANLRASIFGIPLKTRFDVKQMAGNIIPAIATTNAIIAGALILQSLNALKNDWASAKSVWFGRTAQRAINCTTLEKPNPACSVCRACYIRLGVVNEKVKLKTLIEDVAQQWLGVKYDFSISEGSRMLYDPDFDDNMEKTLAEIGLGPGSQVQISDEDAEYMPIIFLLFKLEDGQGLPYGLPNGPPAIRKQQKPVKDELSDRRPGDIDIVGQSRKRTASNAELESPDNKKVKVDVNGTIHLDDDDDDLEIL